MSDNISLHNPKHYRIEAERLVKASRAAVDCHPQAGGCRLSIVFTDSTSMRALNLRYANVDAPTDVLSFRADATPLEPGALDCYLGDIVIAHDYASDQARATATNPGDALCLLAIHGTLHLLGYDHDSKAARERMWAAQDRALRTLNIDRDIVDQYGNSDCVQAH